MTPQNLVKLIPSKQLAKLRLDQDSIVDLEFDMYGVKPGSVYSFAYDIVDDFHDGIRDLTAHEEEIEKVVAAIKARVNTYNQKVKQKTV